MCFGHAYEHTRGECMYVHQKKDKNSVISAVSDFIFSYGVSFPKFKLTFGLD